MGDNTGGTRGNGNLDEEFILGQKKKNWDK